MVPNPEGKGKVADYWEPAKKTLLSDTKLLQNLQEYDKDNIDARIIKEVKKYQVMDDFQPDRVLKASKAAWGLCKWVHAMIVYDRVAKIVEPKKASLEIATKELKAAQDMLAVKQADLKIVEDLLADLQVQLDAAQKKKKDLEDEYEDCSNKLVRAKQLIDGLGGEQVAWSQQSKRIGKLIECVLGDVVLSSGVVAYLGPFTTTYRTDCVKEWAEMLNLKNIPSSEEFSLQDVLGEPTVIRDWVIQKLPNDSFSIDNAIMMMTSGAWPLCIDPQGQANKWIRNMEGATEAGVNVVKQTQSDFARVLENSVQFGIAVLLENVGESLDPLLEPLLLKQIVKAGGVETIKIGDNQPEYDPNFRFYITTKYPNPHYPPETCVKVNLLNFMATQAGLQDQMLGISVKQEMPDLEKQREELVIQDAQNKKELKETEDTILSLLKNAEGNILDDEVLINTLTHRRRRGMRSRRASSGQRRCR
jgi:dynein heavy chain